MERYTAGQNSERDQNQHNQHGVGSIGVEDEFVVAWRFPQSISQSLFGGRLKQSNACTIIVIKIAEIIHRNAIYLGLPLHSGSFRYCPYSYRSTSEQEVLFESKQNCESIFFGKGHSTLSCCPYELLSSLSNAIIEGNELHENLISKRTNDEIKCTIPDALKACDDIFEEVDFCSVQGCIAENLPKYIRAAIIRSNNRQNPHVFIPVISFGRTILLVYHGANGSITCFDSHGHGHINGGMIALSSFDFLIPFSHWICRNIFPETENITPAQQTFEISLIEFCGRLKPCDCAMPNGTRKVRHVFTGPPRTKKSGCKRRNQSQNYIVKSPKF